MTTTEVSTEVQTQLDDMMTTLLLWVEKTGDFVVEQAPLYVQDVLMWAIVDGLMGAAACLLIPAFFSVVIVTSFIHVRKTLPETDRCYFDQRDASGFVVGFSVAGSILTGLIFSLGGLPSLWQAFQAYFAPRVYLVEYLRELIK